MCIKVAVLSLLVWWEDGKMSLGRSRIHAWVPQANENLTMTAENRILTESVLIDTGLFDFLNGLKESQDNSVASDTIALVANSVGMTGPSMLRFLRPELDGRAQNR